MRRDLWFREISLIHTVGFVMGYFVIGVGSALAGAGVWALVLASIANVLVNAILTYTRVRHPAESTLVGLRPNACARTDKWTAARQRCRTSDNLM